MLDARHQTHATAWVTQPRVANKRRAKSGDYIYYQTNPRLTLGNITAIVAYTCNDPLSLAYHIRSKVLVRPNLAIQQPVYAYK